MPKKDSGCNFENQMQGSKNYPVYLLYTIYIVTINL